MNGTAGTADLLWEMSDVRQREAQRENLERLLCGDFARVSNNLGVYFLFCLFGLAILALFLCRSSMQALQTSLFFFVLRRQVWQVFMYQYSFTCTGGVLWISSDRDASWSNGGKNQYPQKSLNQNLASKQSHAKFPSHKNFQKAFNDIPSGYSDGTRASTLYFLFTRDSC